MTTSGLRALGGWLLPLILTGGVTACGGGGGAVGVTGGTSAEVPLGKVGLALRRRAFQLLEDMRGSESAPGWEQARIAGHVRTLFRPDVTDVAYYEFAVVGPADPATMEVDVPGGPRQVGPGDVPRGFIVLSSGAHDFPCPHWDFQGLPPSENLDAMAARTQAKATRYYRLDALTYAAEDEQGRRVAQQGDPLLKVVGMDMAWLDLPAEPSTANYTPDLAGDQALDDAASEIGGTFALTGPDGSEAYELEGWSGWDELKAGYQGSYAVLLESLRRQAAVDWEVEQLRAEDGEGLYAGDVRHLSLLGPKVPAYEVKGVGADSTFLDVALETPPGLPARLRLTVLRSVPGEVLPFTVEIHYPSDTAEDGAPTPAATEVLRFFILDPSGVTEQGTTEAALGSEGLSKQAPAGAGDRIYRETVWWAGRAVDQRYYWQMSPHTGANTSDCQSGCGATAWAMLLGWIDKQASLPSPAYRGRWGLYRVDGGRGANAVAPDSMDAGVERMTWEIRGHIGTFCHMFGDSGPTLPSTMIDVGQYIRGRSLCGASTSYDLFGRCWDEFRDLAAAEIRRGQPAVIGTGWLGHYPLAWGYRHVERTVRRCFLTCWEQLQIERSFYLNQGWGSGASNNAGWVSATSWFCGRAIVLAGPPGGGSGKPAGNP